MRVDTERTLSTHGASTPESGRVAPQPSLVVVLAGSDPTAGGLVVPLDGVRRVDVTRGARLSTTVAAKGRLTLTLPDPKVSTRHAWLEVCASSVVVHDDGARNGCFVGGARVERQAAAGPSVPILLGSTLLTYVTDAAAPTETAWPFATAHRGLADELQKLARLAATPLSVLLLGETGVGKEVVARAIHERSGRTGPFVAVNCAAMPSGLVEAQLFGHKRGAFSGAAHDAPGFFRAAQKGTLLLDEIGDLPLSAQPALLRALQEGEVVAVGATTPQRVDVRVVAATHHALDRLVAAGRFRADLYARLRGFTLTLPPLRERREDLGALVAKIFADHGLGARLSADAVAELYARSWSLNVRELATALIAATHLADGGTIRVADLPPAADVAAAREPARAEPALDDDDQALRDELVARLAAAGGNVSRVARDMGKARQQIQRWMRRFGLQEG